MLFVKKNMIVFEITSFFILGIRIQLEVPTYSSAHWDDNLFASRTPSRRDQDWLEIAGRSSAERENHEQAQRSKHLDAWPETYI